MRRITMRKFGACGPSCAFLLGVLLCLPFAQRALCGPGDADFGKGLLRRKWFDLAEQVFRDLSQNGRTDDERRAGNLGRIEVLKVRAEDESDIEKKKALFEEAALRFRKYLEVSQDPDAQFSLAELLKEKGMEFAGLAGNAEDEKEKKALEEEALKAFTEAEGLLKEVAGKLKSEVDAAGGLEGEQDENRGTELSDDMKDRYQRAAYYRADLNYEMSKIFEGNMEKKISALKEAIRLFVDFIWTFDGYVSTFYAYIRKGQCFAEMGQYEQAIEDYKSAMLVGQSEEGEEYAPEMLKQAEIIKKKAYRHILEALNLARKHDIALAEARKMEEAFPDLLNPSSENFLDSGFAVIEKARAFAGKGDYAGAIGTILVLVKTGGPHARSTVKLLSEWGSCDPSATMTVAFYRGVGFLGEGKYDKAVEAFEETISKLSTPDDIRALGARTWHELGQAYYRQHRFLEAGLAFEQGECAWGDGRLQEEGEEHWGSTCAYYAYSAFKSAYGILKGDFLKSVYSEKRMLLTTKYPESKYARNLIVFAGQDKMAEGKFTEAIELFQGIDKSSDFYEDVQSKIGRCFFGLYETSRKEDEARFKSDDPLKYERDRAAGRIEVSESSRKHLEAAEMKLLEYVSITERNAPEDREHEVRRRNSMAVALFYLGRICDEKNDFEKVLKFLDEFETRFKDMPDLVMPASFLRLRAFFARENSRGVEDMCIVLKNIDSSLRDKQNRKKEHEYMTAGAQLAGKLFGDLAGRARMDGQMEAAAEYSEKAAKYLWDACQDLLQDWRDVNPAQAVAKLDAVGIRQFQARAFDKAALIYETILNNFSDVLSNRQRKEFKMKAGDCYIEMEDWEHAMRVFENLNKMSFNLQFAEKLVSVYEKYGDRLCRERKEKEAHAMYHSALDLYGVLLKDFDDSRQDCWVWKLGVWKIMFKKGLFRDIADQITRIKAMYPELGGPMTRDEIEKMLEQARERAR